MKTKKYRFFSIIIVAVFLVTLYREYDTSELQTLLTCSNTRRMQTKVVENKEYSNISQIMLQQNWELPRNN